MSAIGPGDWVECVDNGDRDPTRPNTYRLLRLGAIYQVQKIGFAPSGDQAIWLVEVKSEIPETGFWPDRFRPIYRPNAELIGALKAPPVRVSEPA